MGGSIGQASPLLVAASAGLDHIKAAHASAVARHYRFFS
jgi:S-adenosylmethionine:tRNA-ribosyltransferase-isomerase (queuine synthetase)